MCWPKQTKGTYFSSSAPSSFSSFLFVGFYISARTETLITDKTPDKTPQEI